MGLVISLLTSKVLDWMSPLEQNSPVLLNCDAFQKAFSTIFEDLHWICSTEAALWKLHQGKGLVISYAAHFQRLVADVKWNGAAQLYQFW